ncbi:MAG: sulfatase-like hydrolase/transferase [Erysipelotrichaceae bacterium]|nr:sulfatase-like hydrolase/transferase [Erysipelotrichaceae bacterium]
MRKIKNVFWMFCGILAADLIFYLIAFNTLSFTALCRMIAVALFLSSIICFGTSRLSGAWETVITFVVLLLLGIYGYIELEFKNFIETYYSFQAVADGGFRVTTFVAYFIKMAKPTYYLCVVPAILYLIMRLIMHLKTGRKFEKDRLPLKYAFISLAGLALLVISFIFGEQPLKEAVKNQDNFDTIMAHTSVNAFLMEDISSLFRSRENGLDLDDVVIEDQNGDAEDEPEEISYKREFDDSKWKSDYENETNETMKTIDAFLMNRKIEDKNDKTGIYEGYNFIYFLVESLDYVGIDKELTPTIWKMMEEGYFFPNHYTLVFSCGTGDSEFVAMTSMMSYGSSCTVYSVIYNNLKASIAGLFKNAGYPTYEFHNWDDTFYQRSVLSEAYGVDTYMDIEDLDFDIVYGWQSDSILAEKTMQYYINDDKFFVFYVTSTMHWPYDESSYYGDFYLDEINKVHPDYPQDLKRYISKTMEFDKMLKTLMDGLEKAGKLDNTVFCFWPDHHPFNTPAANIVKYTTIVDRSDTYGFYKGPLIIYNSADKGEKIQSVCSTFDQLPTVANMFGLNYDPRLYIGSDIFNDDCTVVMPNADWIDNTGIHINSSDEFIPFNENDSYTQEEIDSKSTYVRNLIKVGRAMVSNDYYAKREYLIDPESR